MTKERFEQIKADAAIGYLNPIQVNQLFWYIEELEREIENLKKEKE